MDVICFGEPLVGFYPVNNGALSRDCMIKKTWGGDTSNVAIGISRLGKSSAYITRVGNDPFGEGFIRLWQENEVDTRYVDVDSQRSTGLYFVSFEGKKHKLTYYRKGSAASAASADTITEQQVLNTKVIHLSGISLGMSASAAEAGGKLIELGKQHKRIISFDVNYRPAQWNNRKHAGTTIQGAIGRGPDVLEITDDEMIALGWGSDPEKLKSMFPDVHIILFKQGKAGATIITEQESIKVNQCPVDVADTVGAGDSFDAGFIVSLLDGKTVKDAAVFATATAALTCTGTGPTQCAPTYEEVEKIIRYTGFDG